MMCIDDGLELLKDIRLGTLACVQHSSYGRFKGLELSEFVVCIGNCAFNSRKLLAEILKSELKFWIKFFYTLSRAMQ
jgi:hypothetical protein